MPIISNKPFNAPSPEQMRGVGRMMKLPLNILLEVLTFQGNARAMSCEDTERQKLRSLLRAAETGQRQEGVLDLPRT